MTEQDAALARQFFDQGKQGGPGPSMQMNGDMARQLQLMAATRATVPDFSDAWAEIQRRDDNQAAPRAGMPSMVWTGEFDAAHGAIMSTGPQAAHTLCTS
jgi:hypothetical protein